MAITANKDNGIITGYTDVRDISATKILTTEYDSDFGFLSEKVTQKAGGDGLEFNDLDIAFQDAYLSIISSLPEYLSKTALLTFESDLSGYQIYDATASLVARVSFSSNPDRWENGDGTESINVHSNFNFHDSDWNNLGDVNSWERYEVEAGAALDVTKLADDAAKKAAGLVEYGSGQSTTAELVRGTGEDLGDLTDTIASLSVLDSDDDVVSSEINMVRTWKDTWTSVENDESNSNERQEFFVTSENDNWGEFVGSIEVNGGFSEIRDETWTVVGQVLSADAGSTLDEIDVTTPGFKAAWNVVASDLGWSDAATFVEGQWGDVVVFADGAMLGRINVWSNADEPDRWDNGDGTETINVHSNFNFHDSDWNNLGDVNSWERYEVEAGAALDVTKLADDAAKKAAGLVEYGSGQSTTAELVRGTGEDLGDLTDTIASLSVLDSDDDVVSSEINMVRTWKDTWTSVENDESNSNERQEFFVSSENNNWGEFVGSIEVNGGFSEIRDETWTVVGQVLSADAGSTLDEIDVTTPGFKAAWNVVASDLGWSDAATFVEGQWGDVVVFADGAMLGRINVWSNADEPDRWDNGDGTETINVHSNFNFHDSDWNNLGDVNSWERYEVEAGAALDVTKLADDAAKKAAGLVEYGSGQSTTAELVRGTGEDLGDLTDTIASLSVLDSDDDVVSSEINMVRTWKDTWTSVENDESNSNERQEFFVSSENNNWGEFVGSIEVNGGFSEIRDETWTVVGQVLSADAGSTLDEIDVTTPGFKAAWNVVASDLGWSDAATFVEGQWGDVVVFADGAMLGRINVWSNADEPDRWDNGDGTETINVHSNFNFHDSDWNNLGDVNSWERYEVEAGAALDVTKLADDAAKKAAGLVEYGSGQSTTAELVRGTGEDLGDLTDTIASLSVLDSDDDVVSSEINMVRTWKDTWTSVENDESNSNERQEFFVSSENNNWGEFVGSIEVNGGFSEIRDETWTVVGQVLSADAGSTLDEIDVTTPGFKAAWNVVASDLGWSDAATFVEGQWGDVVVFADGAMLGRINVWSNADEPDRWDNGDGTETINVHSNFNFHDSDWNNLGDVNSWERYEVEAGAALDVTKLADDAAKKAAGLVEYGSGQSTTAELVRGTGEDLGDLTDTIASLSVLDSDDDVVSSEINMVRTWKDTWTSVENDESNSNERQEFFVSSENNNWGEFVGSIEVNGGFSEIRDETWTVVGQVLSADAGSTLDEIDVTTPGFKAAWNVVASDLGWSDAATFVEGQWGDVVVFADGAMLGRINVWSNADEPDRWDNGDGTETINVHSNFNFHDSDWNNLGDVNSWERYEVEAGAALDVTKLADDAAKKAAGLVEYGSGQSTTAELVRGTGEDLGDLTDTIASLSVLDSDDDVVSSEINMVRTWKDTWTSVENDESNSNERQEFFVTSENDNWGEFVGSIVKSDGMVAILNDSGDILSKSITGDGMSFGMISEDPGFLEIWNELEKVLPESVTSNKINLQFYFAEDSSGDEQIWLYLDGDMMVEANIKSSYFTLPTGSFFQTFENETINLSDVNGDLIANVSSTFTYTHSDEYFFDDQHLTYESMTFSYETLNVSEYEMKYSGFVGDYIDWSDVESINVNETIEVLENGTDKQSGSIQFMALSDAVGTKFLGTLEIEGESMILRDANGGILNSNVEIDADAPDIMASIEDADAGNTDEVTVFINRVHDEDITINYSITGTNNFDPIIGKMTISAGKKSGSIDMSVVTDDAIDNNESFIVKLTDISIGSFSNDTANITFDDDDFSLSDAVSNENSDMGILVSIEDMNIVNPDIFFVQSNGIHDDDIMVDFVISADGGFANVNNTMKIPAGETFGSIDLSVLTDKDIESHDNFIITLVSTSHGTIGKEEAQVIFDDSDLTDNEFASGPNYFLLEEDNGVTEMSDARSIDFIDGTTVIDLGSSLDFADLDISQGQQEYSADTIIKNKLDGNYLAILNDIDVGSITEDDFIAMDIV